MSILRTGVVGVGHMGINHARIYSQLENCTLSAVYDKNHDAARYVARKYRTHAASSLEEFAGLVDAATICTPTVTHYEIGAFHGILTLFFSSRAKLVIAYEPNPPSGNRLLRNLRLVARRHPGAGRPVRLLARGHADWNAARRACVARADALPDRRRLPARDRLAPARAAARGRSGRRVTAG